MFDCGGVTAAVAFWSIGASSCSTWHALVRCPGGRPGGWVGSRELDQPGVGTRSAGGPAIRSEASIRVIWGCQPLVKGLVIWVAQGLGPFFPATTFPVVGFVTEPGVDMSLQRTPPVTVVVMLF